MALASWALPESSFEPLHDFVVGGSDSERRNTQRPGYRRGCGSFLIVTCLPLAERSPASSGGMLCGSRTLSRCALLPTPRGQLLEKKAKVLQLRNFPTFGRGIVFDSGACIVGSLLRFVLRSSSYRCSPCPTEIPIRLLRFARLFALEVYFEIRLARTPRFHLRSKGYSMDCNGCRCLLSWPLVVPLGCSLSVALPAL